MKAKARKYNFLSSEICSSRVVLQEYDIKLAKFHGVGVDLRERNGGVFHDTLVGGAIPCANKI